MLSQLVTYVDNGHGIEIIGNHPAIGTCIQILHVTHL